jgi:alpha-galactosidase
MSSENRLNSVTALYAGEDLPANALDNTAWEHCQIVPIERLWSGDMAGNERHARAAIVWTNQSLNVRFVCSQQEPLVVSEHPVTSSKTLGLWDRDVCEIFLAPNLMDIRKYFEFEAAPTGEWVDLGLQITPNGRVTDWDFASGMTTAASLLDQTLTVSIRIPWSSILPKPEAGDEWRANLFRCVGPEAPERYLAWQPTRTPEPNFHVPEAFGYLRFA